MGKIVPSCIASNNETVYVAARVTSAGWESTLKIALVKSSLFPSPPITYSDPGITWSLISLIPASSVVPFILPDKKAEGYDTNMVCVVDDNGRFTMSIFQYNLPVNQKTVHTIQFNPQTSNWTQLDEMSIEFWYGQFRLFNMKDPSSNNTILYHATFPQMSPATEHMNITVGPLTSDNKSGNNSLSFPMTITGNNTSVYTGLDAVRYAGDNLYILYSHGPVPSNDGSQYNQTLVGYPITHPLSSDAFNKSIIVPWKSSCSIRSPLESLNSDLYLSCLSFDGGQHDLFIINESGLKSQWTAPTLTPPSYGMTPVPYKNQSQQTVFFRRYFSVDYASLTAGARTLTWSKEYNITVLDSISTPDDQISKPPECDESCSFSRTMTILFVVIVVSVVLALSVCIGCICYFSKKRNRKRQREALLAAASIGEELTERHSNEIGENNESNQDNQNNQTGIRDQRGEDQVDENDNGEGTSQVNTRRNDIGEIQAA